MQKQGIENNRSALQKCQEILQNNYLPKKDGCLRVSTKIFLSKSSNISVKPLSYSVQTLFLGVSNLVTQGKTGSPL